jgi:hypothetical protein
MPSNLKWLLLWGILMETVDAYSLDSSEKKLIHWVSVDRLCMCMVLDENGKILFGWCSVHWCWKRLHAWDTIVSYSSPRYLHFLHLFVIIGSHNVSCRCMGIIGGMEVVCEDCWIVLVNCLCFPGMHPPGTRWELLLELQTLVTGLQWTKDYPSTKPGKQ